MRQALWRNCFLFGTLTIYKDRLNEEEQAAYQAYYCGLCKTLREKYGIKSQLILTYDCTFLAMLLQAVYELPEEVKEVPCLHRFKKVRVYRNEAFDYAADMNLLLSYQNFCDKEFDGKTSALRKAARAAAGRLKKDYALVRSHYPRQAEALERYMIDLQAHEKDPADDAVEYAANLTGTMLSEIFVRQEDEFSGYLRKLAYHLGKFIYLSDAYEDLEEDLESGNYNPLLAVRERPDFESFFRTLLESVMAEATKYFEMLPIFEHREILRNILYSGIWIPYAHALKKREEERKKQGEKS